MKAATVNEIKKELASLEAQALVDLCLRLAKFKKDNKELLTYLLYEAQDEQAYVRTIKADMDEQFIALPTTSVYYFKKSLRRILRVVNRQIRYSGVPASELELRIHFCTLFRNSGVPLDKSPVLLNLYQQQMKKLHGMITKLPEDLQFDYQHDIEKLSS